MPVKDCTTNGKPGKKWGDQGHCYPCASGDCSGATKKALAQGAAIAAGKKSAREDTVMTTAAAALRTGTPHPPPTDRVLRVTPFAVRAADPGAPEADGLTIDGFAAVFNRETLIDSWEGRFWEALAPGSMKRSFRELMPKMQFDHGTHPMIGSMPIASVRSVREEVDPVLAPEGGAHVIGRLFDNWLTLPVRDAIAEGAVNGMSFRMSVLREEWRTPDGEVLRDPAKIEEHLFRSWWEDVPADELLHRTLQEVRVPELGPVVWPAYTDTSVGVRADRVVVDLAAARAGSPEERRKIAALLFEADNPRERGPAGSTLPMAEQDAQGPSTERSSDTHPPTPQPDAQEPPAPRPESHNPSPRRRDLDIALDQIRSRVLRFPSSPPQQ